MDSGSEIAAAAAWAAPLAALSLWLLRRNGHLCRDALRQAPERDVPVTPIDVVFALGLIVAGSVAGQAIFGRWAFPTDESGAPIPAGGVRPAAATLGMQVLSLGPVAALLAFRAMETTAGLRRIGLVPRWPGRDARWGVLSLLASLPLVMVASLAAAAVAAALGQEAPEVGHEALTRMREEPSVAAVAIMIASAVVVAPLLEEVAFRGLLQTALLRALGDRRRWAVIAIAAPLFASVHLSAGTWQSLPPLLLLGVIWGYLYERTGSLWPGVIAHAGFNAYNIAVALLILPG